MQGKSLVYLAHTGPAVPAERTRHAVRAVGCARLRITEEPLHVDAGLATGRDHLAPVARSTRVRRLARSQLRLFGRPHDHHVDVSQGRSGARKSAVDVEPRPQGVALLRPADLESSVAFDVHRLDRLGVTATSRRIETRVVRGGTCRRRQRQGRENDGDRGHQRAES